jgi:hypothetical protein
VTAPLYAPPSASIEALIECQLGELWVRETDGPNDSPRIREYQRVTGNAPPDPWCASFQAWAGVQVYGHAWPLKLTGSCQQLRLNGILHGRLNRMPAIGSLFLLIDPKRDVAHHVGLVTGDPTRTGIFPTIEGNTNPGGGREGYGVFVRARGGKSDPLHYEFIHLPSGA